MPERAVVRRQVEINHFAFDECAAPPPPSEKTCHIDAVVSHGEVKGHRHREHILILLGKLGRVEARVPDSKKKKKNTLKCKLKTKSYCSEISECTQSDKV